MLNYNNEGDMDDEKGFVREIFGSFQGEGPYIGERHIFIRFYCCSLDCAYCDTKEARIKGAEAFIEEEAGKFAVVDNPLSAAAVARAALDLEPFPGYSQAVCITGGEPLEQPGFLAAVLRELGGRLRVILETNGTLPDALARVRALVDVISMDVKLPSVSGLGPLWDAHRAFIGARGDKELVVKAVVSPETPLSEVAQAAALVAEAAPDAAFIIQPLAAPAGKTEVTAGLLAGFYAEARRRVRTVRVIPQAHRMLGVK